MAENTALPIESDHTGQEPDPRRARPWAAVLALVLATGGILVVVEGVAGWVGFVADLATEQLTVRMAEESHSMFDPEIGWVSRPRTTVEGLYGPGTRLETDERGFRGSGPVTVDVPEGTDRLLCSGDSFTLGYGVNQEDTWCALLGARRGYASINLGQGGYGIGQAYLWYRRAAADLDRSVHMVAFIGDDFRRLGATHFLGFGKPLVRAVDGRPVVINAPVRERGWMARWLSVNGHLLNRLATVRLLQALGRRVGFGGDQGGSAGHDETWAAAMAIFDALRAENAERGAAVLLVFLPAPWDYERDLYAEWRVRVAEYAGVTGAPFVDLIDPLRELEPDAVERLFIPAGALGENHLTPEGNRWVAERLAPVVDQLIGRGPPAATSGAR